MTTIRLEIARDDTATLTRLQDLQDEGMVIATPDHFEGGVEIVSILITLTTASIPIIASIVKELIRSKRHIKVKMKGIEIAGASLADIEKFLLSIKDSG